MSLEITILLYSLLLLAIMAAAEGLSYTLIHGPKQSSQGRDGFPIIHPGMPGRLYRAIQNYKENLLIFIPLILVAHQLGISNENTQLGAQLFLAARIVYVPMYLWSVPFLRSIAFAVSLFGCILITYGIL